jgi:hypothetical protein
METEAGAMLAEIARLELFGGKLEVHIQHFGVSGMSSKWSDGPAPGNTVAYLNGEDRFAGIGVGEEDTEFALVPEIAEEHLRRGRVLFEGDPVVSGVKGEKVLAIIGHLAEFAGTAGGIGELPCFGTYHFYFGGSFEGHGVVIVE